MKKGRVNEKAVRKNETAFTPLLQQNKFKSNKIMLRNKFVRNLS